MAKIVLQIVPKNKEATQSVRVLNAELETLSKTLSTIKVNKNLTTQINALTKYYKAVADAQAKIIVNANKQAIIDEKPALAQAKVATQTAKINTENAKRAKIEAQTQKAVKLTTSQTEKLVKGYADLLNNIKSLERNYKKGTFNNVTAQIRDYFNEVKGLDDELNGGAITQEEYNNKVIQATASLQDFKAEVASTKTEAKNMHGTLQDTVSGFLQFQLSAMLVMKPLQMIRSALSSINETLVKTEDAVITLQRVLPSNSASDSEISSRLYKIAQDYGQTFENVSQIATNFARTGMSWADTIKATEAAVLALNVAELDATQASDGMIAILTQFGIKAENLTLVVDKLNITADNAAVTTDKLLAALQRTGSAAANANLSLDETVSLITALSQATGRSGENLGTALNSLIQYSSKSSALEVFAGLSDNTANVVAEYRKGAKNILDVWQAVSAEIKNLTTEQANLLDSYFSTEDGNALKEALDGELEDIYTELGGVYDTANTFRKNYFIALLGNMDTVLQAQETLKNAQGYSQEENQKYLDTYTAKQNSVQAKWQDIANDEQGLLGIKKDLLDIGSFILDIVQGIGGLKTAIIATGIVVGTIVMSFKGEVIIATLTKIGTILKSLTIDAIPNAVGAWKSFAKGISSAGTALQASLPLITAVVIAISAITSAIQKNNEEQIRLHKEGIANASDNLSTLRDTIKSNVEEYDEIINKIKEARETLADSSSTTVEVTSAENSLLNIQTQLIKSNHDYADSIDLVKGNLDEQIDLLSTMEEAEAKKQVKDYLRANSDAILNAKNYQAEKVGEVVFDESQSIYSEHQLADYLKSAGNKIEYAPSGEGLSRIWNAFGALFGANGVTATTVYGDKTRQEWIDYLNQLIEDIEKNPEISKEETEYLIAKLTSGIKSLQDETFQNVQNILSGSDNKWNAPIETLEKFRDGLITYEQFLKEIGLLEENVEDTTEEWHNNISKVTSKYDDLISKLEELRDLNKEAYNWEEKKLAVLEAQQALENARNEATVRRFNQATGQWEWQTDEKKIAEAEKNLEQAQLNLQEAAYSNIIEQLEKGDATNESILAILQEVAPLLGADNDFVDAVINAFKDKTGVDITKPAISNFDAAQNYINEKGLKESDREKWTEDKTFEKLFNTLTDEEKAKLKGKSYDSGGIANGLGFMAKATAQPETVNDPELTKKILTPVSNAEFDRYVKDMGIMFETARQYSQRPIIERVGGNSDNRIDNSGQITMNGVTIGSDRRGNTLDELLTLAKIVPN